MKKMNSIIKNNIKYCKLNKSFHNDFALGIAKSFAEHEPIQKYFKYTQEDVFEVDSRILPFCNEATVVALDTTNNDKLVGGIEAIDFVDFRLNRSKFLVPKKKCNKDEEEEPLYIILKNLEETYYNSKNKEKTVNKNDVLYFYGMFVDANYTNRSIGKQILDLAESYASHLGYKSMFCIATGPISQHIFLKRNFVLQNEVVYRTFETNNGTKPFLNMGPIGTESCMLLEKILSN
jgi:N-acetylglutamate synthase-like GNAT family acetyltransferase